MDHHCTWNNMMFFDGSKNLCEFHKKTLVRRALGRQTIPKIAQPGTSLQGESVIFWIGIIDIYYFWEDE